MPEENANKLVEAKGDGVIKPKHFNFINFKQGEVYAYKQNQVKIEVPWDVKKTKSIKIQSPES